MARYVDIEPYEDCRIILNKEDVGFPCRDLPTADVEEVRHGEWIRDDDLIDSEVWSKWSCSECGYVLTQGWEYTANGKKPCAKLCENCGAKMDGGME